MCFLAKPSKWVLAYKQPSFVCRYTTFPFDFHFSFLVQTCPLILAVAVVDLIGYLFREF
ncbi:hypothetical protein GALMADRAFT_831669 [Galerina marginata CBS 339.88]|uniref:Uncharacterized protein n=1 Tax=Galerina marginata (strain CBS 339.88) TaxID=685588 RepID=A0A067THG4_GALM3|nr:hypothetical protein GALMADRAFT_831669 [Galerina marginata CBS 339.88]